LKQIIKIVALIGMFFCTSLAQAADLFSDDWMKGFMEAWNNDSTITEPLAGINFDSNIAYGFKGDEQPTGLLVVKKGIAISAGTYNGEELNWDLRAPKDKWEKWIKEGVSKVDLFKPAWMGGLKFEKGNYSAMLKNPSMMGPFMKSFTVMGQVK